MAGPSLPKGKFNPLANPYKTWGDFNAAAAASAQSQIQPKLNDLGAQGREATSAHSGREADIGAGYKYYGDTLNQSFDSTRNALNSLAALRASSSDAGRQTLAAALGATNRGLQEQNTLYSGGAPQNAPDMSRALATLAADYGVGEASNFATTNAFGTTLARMGADRSLAPLGRIDASDDEARRFRAQQKGLTQQKSDLLATLPGLTTAGRQTLMDQALKAQNQGFTQRLAGKELGLKTDTLAHQKAVDAANLKLNWAQVNLKKQDLANQTAAAQGTANADATKLRQQAFNTGVGLLSGFLAPQSKAEKKNPSKIRRNPMDAYRILTKQANLPSHDAIQLIHSISDPAFQHFTLRNKKGFGGVGVTGHSSTGQPTSSNPLSGTR